MLYQSSSHPTKGTLIADLIYLILIIGSFFSFMLGSRPLSAPDEGRYTEIAREMAISQDYVTPRLNGVKYFEKPPLVYWLSSFIIRIFGIKEWALRLLPAVFGLLGIVSIYLFTAHYFSRASAIWSSLVLASNILFYAHSRLLILDMGLTFFLTMSLLGFLGSTQDQSSKCTYTLLCFFIGAALAVLTKGLIGIVLPGAIILIWCLLMNNFQPLKLILKPWGIALFLLITCPWHILAIWRNKEFFHFYFIHEHLLRYLTTIHNRSQPVWFFLPIILIGWFPWSTFLVSTLKDYWRKGKQNPIILFLLVWIAFTLLVFSISNSKLIPYILPIFPALAILIGDKLAYVWHTPNSLSKYLPLSTGTFSILVASTAPFAIHYHKLDNIKLITPYLIILITILLSIGLLLIALAYLPVSEKNYRRLTLKLHLVLGYLLLSTLNAAWPYLDRRSIKPLAMIINKYKSYEDKVISYGRYYQDLPPYIKSKVIIVGWRGELEAGMLAEDTSKWMLTKADFLERYNSLGNFYLITRKNLVTELKVISPQKLKIVAEIGDDVLLTNK